ncbi:MAG: hypothetical protein QM778_20315 [Myxococcales bacterium]
MMGRFSGLVLVALATLVFAQPARADGVGIELAGLIGTGVDTGKADNNPYALQIGAAADLIVAGWVLGFRYTRSVGTNADCVGPNCRNVDDVRTLGADLGWDWQLLKILHISPRFGVGQVREANDGLRAPYIEPGGVAEVQIALLVVGVDLRYRVAIKDTVANGFLANARIGLRF